VAVVFAACVAAVVGVAGVVGETADWQP
jgi:hypothetical protein